MGGNQSKDSCTSLPFDCFSAQSVVQISSKKYDVDSLLSFVAQLSFPTPKNLPFYRFCFYCPCIMYMGKISGPHKATRELLYSLLC